jgi:cytochrome bd-type quinol oxidase subunit 1
MGVVSGIIMPFQFGTNWSRFTDATADVLSPLLAYEGLMAFFSRLHSSGFCCSGDTWCRPGRIFLRR